MRASARASAELVGSATRSVERAAAPAARELVAVGADVARAVGRADIGVGQVRLSPDGLAWVREQVARGLRDLLTADVDGEQLLRAGDPVVMARAVLSLLGGEERLAPLPGPDEQIRQRFRALLAPDATDVEAMTPALLAITAQLSPDEARILRHLHEEGPVPEVSVLAGSRTRRTGPVAAEHLTLVTEQAGGDHPERGPAHVDNLLRLGLCTLEPDGPQHGRDVDLIRAGEAYRTAAAAVRRDGGRPRERVRTLRLTALGRQLVDIALHGAGSGATTAQELTGPPPPPAEATTHHLP